MSPTLQVRGGVQQQVLRPGKFVTPGFHQLKLLQCWQPMNLRGALDACHRYGFTGIVVKALDGENWMSSFDNSPDAIGSVDDVAYQASVARAEGLYYFCWTVPKDQGDIALQATLSAMVAARCDGLFLDVEPYAPSFWGSFRPEGDAQQFMTWLRRENPESFVALQPDPRPNALDEIRVAEWLPSVDALSTQSYWSDFGSSPAAELGYAVTLGQRFGPSVLPTLPGNAPGAFPMEQIAQLPGFVCWRYGSTPPSTLELLGAATITGFTSSRIPAR